MSSISLYQVDSFTDSPFAGNPAGVAIITDPKKDVPKQWMANLATEMMLSETAFVQRLTNSKDCSNFSIRWFTPDQTEVDLCGHATLASAHALWSEGFVSKNKEISFESRSGPLYANSISENINGQQKEFVELNFPANPVNSITRDANSDVDILLSSLNLSSENILFLGKTSADYFIEINSEKCLHSLSPKYDQLVKVATRGIIVTCRAEGPGQDFQSRFFAPAVGVNEDPVTGSAHCGLACYWEQKLSTAGSGRWLVGYQASERGGIVRCKREGDRVKIAGEALTVFSAQLNKAALPKSKL